jgi:SprT protein
MRRHPDGRLEIRYNLQMASLQPERFLSETVTHEVAHLLTWLLHGRNARPHGPEWQSMMRFLGIESPRRCHDFRGGEPARRQRRWSYRCACRTHHLSTTRHNRIQKGARYQCAACGGALQALKTTS